MGSASILGVLDGVASSCVVVNQTRCAKVRNRNVSCLKCAAACTSGCIALVDGELRIDASKCVGCGTCATVCPTCALEARNPTDAELLSECRAASRDGLVAIGCSLELEALDGVADTAGFARVVCAGRIDESLLVQLAVDGCREVCIVCGNCERCEQRAGRATLQLVIDNARAILSTWGCDCKLTTRLPEQLLLAGASIDDAKAAEEAFFSLKRANLPVNPLPPQPALHQIGTGDDSQTGAEDGRGIPDTASDTRDGATYPVPRPQALLDGGECREPAGAGAAGDEVPRLSGEELEEALGTFFKKRVKVKIQPSLVKVMKDGTLPHFLPDRRERLLNALAQLGEPQVRSLETRLWGCVVIDGTKCSSCQMCATFCPTGAISKYVDEDGAFGVTHYPGDCVKCGSCADICNEGAIKLLNNVDVAYLLDGTVHRYVMRPRAIALGPHQMKDTMQQYMDIPIYER